MPGLPRLRGIAAFNSMAILQLKMKPSLLKTLEALPQHGLAIYLTGSMLNHSCLPNVARWPFESSLLLRATRHLEPKAELNCAYVEVRAPFFARQKDLESTWAFQPLDLPLHRI